MNHVVRGISAAVVVVLAACAAQGARATDNLPAREEQAIKAAMARVAPSVVRIETAGGLERVGQMLVGTGPTTGLVVSSDGLIVSSAFNFVQKPDSILVTLAGGARHAARLVATDHSRMLVLLKIDPAEPLTVPVAVPREEMRPGQWALAAGRAFEPGQLNLSVGIISAVDRIWGKAVQTDAKISPNNYGGPLVDISGRVFGVLVPMSPQGGSEVAGVEWYDSGIGFAVPLESVLRVLPRLAAGEELRAGLLGINLKGTDIFSDPALIAAARATGPAYKAGMRAGDTIVEVAGQPVTRQAELKQQLGPLYAGDKARIVFARGDQRLEREIELVDKVPAYEFPFVGILPMRSAKDEQPGELTVRWVYPDSPAAVAGVQASDRIVKFSDHDVHSAADVAEALENLAPEQSVKLSLRRGDETRDVEIRLGRLPEAVPGELPPAHAAAAPAGAAEKVEIGKLSLKIPELPNECLAYVPERYRQGLPHGLVLWLGGTPAAKPEELVERWKGLCERHELILVAPAPSEKGAWQPTDARLVRRVLDAALKAYAIDPARVLVAGQQSGGALAYLVGLSNPDAVRAVAAHEAPLPRAIATLETDPVHRLAFFTTLPAEGPLRVLTDSGIKRLRDAKFPVVVAGPGDAAEHALSAEQLAELARWLDSLDRL